MLRGSLTALALVLAGAVAAQEAGQPLPPLGEPLVFDPVTGEVILSGTETTDETGVVSAPELPFTLEDLRRELVFIGEAVDGLRSQARPSGVSIPSDGADGATPEAPQVDVLSRINALESRLQEVQSELDTLRFDIDRIAEDGGRRLSDMDFRLTLVEQGDPSFVPPPAPLGDGVTDPDAQQGSPFGDSQIALAEQFAFDAAITAFDGRDFALAQQQFDAFLQVYPDGPLSDQARFRLVDIQFEQRQFGQAAGAYLEVFQSAPTGPLAPDAMLGLGSSLARLGQTTEACLTFDEALARYSAVGGDAFFQELQLERQRFSCP
jgi:tol-pal system protein YbgF